MLCVGVLSSAGIALAASPAQAEPTETTCMIVLPGPSELRCFASDDEARKFAAEHGAVIAPSKGESSAARELGPNLASRAGVATTLTLIGTEYALPGYLGDKILVYGSGGQCTGTVNDIDYELPDWSVYGFDQRISSFKTAGNCWAKHYDLVNFLGLAVGYQGSQFVINAALDNDTSSERWS